MGNLNHIDCGLIHFVLGSIPNGAGLIVEGVSFSRSAITARCAVASAPKFVVVIPR